MPGDPKQCRQHAERCAELARLASTPEARDQFLSLQMTWIRLASELDQARALIEVTQELEKRNSRSRLEFPVETSFPRGLTGFSLELAQKQVPPSFVRLSSSPRTPIPIPSSASTNRCQTPQLSQNHSIASALLAQ